MLHRTQQLRIDPRPPRQRSRIQTVVLLPTLSDQAHVARMRHDHFVSQLAQQPAHPRRVHSGLQRDPTARHGSEHFLHRFGSRASFCSSSTSPASSSTQYQLERSPRSRPIVSFFPEIFLLCFTATVLIFFIAGLLYLLCLKHVDNLGAYSIPSETGLLIPSVYINYPVQIVIKPFFVQDGLL